MAVVIPIDMTSQFLISFLFVLAIVFGALQVANVFKNKAVHAVIAVAISLFATMYQPFQLTLWSYLPNVTWFFIVMFFVAFIMEIMGFRKKKAVSREGLIIQTGVLFVLLSIGYMVADMMVLDIPLIGSMDNLVFIIGLVMIISIFLTVTKMEFGPPPAPKEEKK